MKNYRLFAAVFVVLLMCAFASKTSAQIAGGYGEAEVKSKSVSSAAAFAVRSEARKTKKHFKLISVSKAEQQVVAGLNYNLCLKVRDGKRTRTANAIVYQNLRQKFSLTDWKWDECSTLAISE